MRSSSSRILQSVRDLGATLGHSWGRGRGELSLAAMLAVLMLPPVVQEAPRNGGGSPGLSSSSPPDDAASPQDAEADPDADPATDPRTRTQRRLLRLRQGGVLRANTRWSGDHWEFQREGRWEALHPALIESDRLETDALADAGKRRAKVRRDDAAGLAAHAGWLIETGLYAEGLQLLDDVLQLDADQPEALALVRETTLPVGVPSLAVPLPQLEAARAEVLSFAKTAPRVLQELAVEELRTLPDDPAVRAALRAELGALLMDRSAQAREFGALALRRLILPEALQQGEVEECLRRAVRDVAPDVRVQASLVLRDAREEALIVPVVKSLGSPSSTLRTQAAESLGLMGYAAAVAPLMEHLLTLSASGGGFQAPRANVFVGSQIAYVAGFDVEVAQNAAIGNPQIGTLQEGATLDVSVLGVSGDGYLAESKALRGALTRLTGADPGPTKSAWKAWWSKHAAEWSGSPDSGPVTGVGSGPVSR